MVNCKNCRWWSKTSVEGFMPEYHKCDAFSIYMKAEDFCSRFEKYVPIEDEEEDEDDE